MFRATNSPILRSAFDCIYSVWYNAPTLLPTKQDATTFSFINLFKSALHFSGDKFARNM